MHNNHKMKKKNKGAGRYYKLRKKNPEHSKQVKISLIERVSIASFQLKQGLSTGRGIAFPSIFNVINL
jgi:hypothetical protein